MRFRSRALTARGRLLALILAFAIVAPVLGRISRCRCAGDRAGPHNGHSVNDLCATGPSSLLSFHAPGEHAAFDRMLIGELRRSCLDF
jgi:hypothetical protein